MSINKVTIVGIKGFKGSGKDTVASMISYILHDGIMKASYDTWLLYHKNGFVENDEIIIHFADKLKDDISEFCGIDRKLLDKQEIKEIIIIILRLVLFLQILKTFFMLLIIVMMLY